MLKAIRNLVDLANQITGTLPVSNGGTGATSLTSNRLIKGDGTAALSVSNLYDDGSNAGVASGAFVIDADFSGLASGATTVYVTPGQGL